MWNDLTSRSVSREPEKKSAEKERIGSKYLVVQLKIRNWPERDEGKREKEDIAGSQRSLSRVPPAYPDIAALLPLSTRSVRQLTDSSLLSYCISRTPEAACQPALSNRSNEKKKRREREGKRQWNPEKARDIYRVEKEITKKKKGEKWRERNGGRKETDVKDGQSNWHFLWVNRPRKKERRWRWGDIPLFRIFPFSLACVIYKDRKAPSVIRQ